MVNIILPWDSTYNSKAIVSFFVCVTSRNNLSLTERVLVKVYNRNSFLLKPVDYNKFWLNSEKCNKNLALKPA